MVRWAYVLVLALAGCAGEDAPVVNNDADGDGVVVSEDCDDADAAIGGPFDAYTDLDGDGYGAAAVTTCTLGDGLVTLGSDCDDANDVIYPYAQELCDDDGVDEDCDGVVDDADASVDYDSMANVWPDNDGDGFGDGSTAPVRRCHSDELWLEDSSDCDDTDPAIHVGADEYCNDHDDDCDGDVDEGSALDTADIYADRDGDGYGDPDVTMNSCPREGWVSDGTDCEDARVEVHPGAEERCNGADDDCDGTADNDAVDARPWHADADGDGFGDVADEVYACTSDGRLRDASDCDDSDGAIFPGAVEVCGDSVDDDCNGVAVCDLTTSSADRTFAGIATGAGFGSDLASTDLDGDGVTDLLFGTGGTSDDAAYVAAGGGTGNIDMDAATAAFTCDDGACAGAGVYVAGLADTDADGDGELAIGAAGPDGAGAVYLFHGPVSGTVSLTDAEAHWAGAAAGDDASELRLTGDVDGDGTSDLLVGAPGVDTGAGAVYLVTTYDSGLSDIETLATAAVYGEAAGDALSISGGRGDLDGDGADDLVIGAPGHDSNGTNSGSMFIFFGPVAGNLATADADLSLAGAAPGDVLGLSSVGDLDGDGYADLGMGADDGGTDTFVYLLAGPLDTGAALGDAVGTIEGLGATLTAMSAGGDIDTDGRADLLLGYGDDARGGVDAGAAALFRGPVTGAVTTDEADWFISGTVAGAATGTVARFVSAQDGTDGSEILLAAPGDGDGATYLFYGDNL